MVHLETITTGNLIELTATSSDSSTITWSKSNSNVSLSSTTGNTITVTGVTSGTSTVYATNTSGAKASCSITIASSGGGQGTESSDFTIDFRENGNCSATSGSFELVNFSTSKNSAQNAPAYNSAGELRLYYASTGNGNSLTLTPATNYKITEVVLTATTTSYTPTVKYNVDGGSDASVNWSSTTMTISNIEASTSFVFRNANTSNTQLRISTITISFSTTVSKTLSSISVSGMTTSYTVGDAFGFDGTCTATYSSGSPKTVVPSSVSSPDMSTPGTKTVTVTYTEGGVTKTTTYQITVKTPATLSSLSKTGSLSKTSYYDGDAFDSTGLTITATYSDSTTKNVTSDIAWTPSPLTAGTTSVVGSYGGKTITISGITVQSLTLSSIAISGQTTTYIVGDVFSFDGSVVATYANGSKKQVEATSVDESGINMSSEGNYSVRVFYSENGITRSATYTISVTSLPFVNTIEECYSKSKNATCTNVYGLYVGSFNNGQSSMIMNGEYGIMLYQTAPDSSWVENQTYLCVTTSTLDIYNNLYELKSVTTTKVTDAAVIRQNIAPITIYTVTGTENTTDLTVANRLCLMSGTVTSITHKESNNTVSGWKDSVDNTINMNVGGNSIQLFVKSATASTEVGTAIKNSLNNSTEITIKGFTGFYSTSFQVQFKNLVVADSSYTAEDFAQELLDATTSICANSLNKENDLSGVWTTFEIDKWPTLPANQQNVLLAASANENGTIIEKAMARYDLICKKYASCDNFIGRASANGASPIKVAGVNNNFIIVVMSATVVITLSLFATFKLLKKRKER